MALLELASTNLNNTIFRLFSLLSRGARFEQRFLANEDAARRLDLQAGHIPNGPTESALVLSRYGEFFELRQLSICRGDRSFTSCCNIHSSCGKRGKGLTRPALCYLGCGLSETQSSYGRAAVVNLVRSASPSHRIPCQTESEHRVLVPVLAFSLRHIIHMPCSHHAHEDWTWSFQIARLAALVAGQ
jgi:hypothetical protein